MRSSWHNPADATLVTRQLQGARIFAHHSSNAR
jgi:hypothetical protein